MQPPADVAALRRSLREAAAWCGERLRADPRAPLWTPEFFDCAHSATSDEPSKSLQAHPRDTVARVVARRAGALAGRSASNWELRGGRVLLCLYDLSLFDGASQLESNGLVDLWDVPAWDTWIGVVPDAAPEMPPPLIAWIPRAFVERANYAVAVNPVEALQWFDDVNRPLARALTRWR